MKSVGRLDLCMLFQGNEYSLASTHYKIKKEGNIKRWNLGEFHEHVVEMHFVFKKNWVSFQFQLASTNTLSSPVECEILMHDLIYNIYNLHKFPDQVTNDVQFKTQCTLIQPSHCYWLSHILLFIYYDWTWNQKTRAWTPSYFTIPLQIKCVFFHGFCFSLYWKRYLVIF